MHSANTSASVFPASDVEPGIFNVVIAYEDFETGKQAKRTYDYLVRNLADESVFNCPMWKFDVLTIPKLLDMAVADAQSADIIMIASRGGSALPSTITQWIEGWIAGGTRAVALVALFDCEPDRSAPVHEYLAGICKRAGLQFFAQPDYWPQKKSALRSSNCPDRDDLNRRAVSTLTGVDPASFGEPTWQLAN